MAKIDPYVAEVLKRYELGQEATWDCHGTTVIYHRFLEQIATRAGISFSQPHIVEANSANNIAAVCVTGELDGRTVWSIGEASPGNYRTKENQPDYPWAMAEKRAVDRVILKLIGLHGFAYSEEEADEFKAGPKEKPLASGAFGKTEARKAMGVLSELIHDIEQTPDEQMLDAHLADHKSLLDQVRRDWGEWIEGIPGNNDFVGFDQRVKDLRDDMKEREAIRGAA